MGESRLRKLYRALERELCTPDEAPSDGCSGPGMMLCSCERCKVHRTLQSAQDVKHVFVNDDDAGASNNLTVVVVSGGDFMEVKGVFSVSFGDFN